MPTININKRDFESLIKRIIKKNELENFFLPVKGEVDGYEEGIIKLDVKDSNRPDLWSVEGVARDIKGYLESKKGLPTFKMKESEYSVDVKGLDDIRPYGAYAVAKEVKINENVLRSLIEMQEKICGSFGRKRKEVAIGIFDLDKINGKNLKYYAEHKDKQFVPLGKQTKISLEDVLFEHPKGKEYRHLVEDFDKYPLLVDEKGEVLSMPPIINSENSGKVTTETKNLFIDVTGTNFDKVNQALLIVSMALKDRGAKIESVKVNYGLKHFVTPIVKKMEIKFDKKLIEEYFMPLKDKDIIKLLERKRYDVKIENDKIIATYLNFRNDILHPVDVIEDIIISYGFENIDLEEIDTQTTGRLLNKTKWINLVREATLGLGIQEVMTFNLTSKDKQYSKLEINATPVEIANPMSESIAIFRNKIFPEHLEFLSKNQHIEYPQNIYEVGDTLETDGRNLEQKSKLTITLCYNKVSFTDIKKHTQTLLENIGAKNIKFNKISKNYAIEGRCSSVSYKLGSNTRSGEIFEVHPKVLTNFNLEMPTAIFEGEIDKDI